MECFIEWMIESSLLILMILGIRKIFMGKIRYAGVYALWLVVLLRFFVPVNFVSTPFSVGNMLSNKFSSWTAEEFLQNSTESTDSTAGNIQSVPISTGSETSDFGTMILEKESSLQPLEKNGNISLIYKIQKELIGIWISVSTILFLWFLISNVVRSHKWKRNRTLYGKRENLKIYTVSGIKSPCLYGFFRPVIYLPRCLIYGEKGVRATPEEREQIITHEYVHYRHGDHIWALFRIILILVYWFNPFLWIAVFCSRKDAELFCDETVLRVLGEENRFRYGKMLIRLAADGNWGDFRYPIMSISRKGKEMKTRICAISTRCHYSKWLVIPLLIMVSVVVGFTCSTGIRPLAKDANEESYMEQSEQLDKMNAFFADNADFRNRYEGVADISLTTEEMQISVEDSDAVKGVFQNYISIFTEAVNTGNTDRLCQVLAVDSDVYEQQCNLVQNYYKRGIREEVKNCSISSTETVTPHKVMILSNEKIKVHYGDDTTKLIKQKYLYTCQYKDGNWLITGMEENET